MELEQRMMMKFLRFKGMKLHDIQRELTLVFAEEVYALLQLSAGSMSSKQVEQS
jgi:hypothetical protein